MSWWTTTFSFLSLVLPCDEDVGVFGFDLNHMFGKQSDDCGDFYVFIGHGEALGFTHGVQ